MKIQIKQLKPGMTVSTDIIGPGGIILLPANKTLNNENILLLSKNGVVQVDIKEIDASTPAAAQNPLPENIDQEIMRTRKLPSLHINVSDDAMTASLIIEPTDQDNSDLTIEDIRTALDNYKIISGINEKVIESAVQNWNCKKRRYEITGIASGIPPEPAVEGDVHLPVRCLICESDAKKVRSIRYIWQNSDLLPQIQHIKPGMVVAELQINSSVPGKNVKGEPIFTEKVIKKDITCGNGATFLPDKKMFTSTMDGVLCFFDNILDVIPVSFDGAVDIEVSTNKMTAELIFNPPVEDGMPPKEQDVFDTLQNAHISHGIDESRLKEITSDLKKGIVPEGRILIAQGTAPVNGQNGKITYHFNTQTSLKPKLNPDGSVDYKSIDIVISVGKGEKLATLEPPEKGTSGKNLYGELISCLDGTPARLPVGPNTEPDPQDHDTLIASTDGIVRLAGSTVEVCEGFVINGDVNFSTGNVKYDHSVIVTGDVKSGFDIECGGDLQIGGTIEDCNLKIGGNVLCRFGFCGQSKGLIDAKGDVNLGFMKNQTVRSKKNVNIAREAINSIIFAKESINIHGNPLSVAGGHLTARDSITVNSIGNHSGIKTLCEVGFDFTLGEELHMLEEHLAELVRNQNKIVETIKKIDKTLSFQRNLPVKEQEMRAKLKESQGKYDQQIQSLELRKKIIEKKMYNFEKVFIKFERAAFPGTLFKYGDRHYLVKEEICGPKMVRLIDFEIKIL
ncbi:MAG TPA: FapA family protein [Chitinispirillaceae bacterium]|nr:FapA family protein [Chitinispirillaceae bacterium]